MSKYQELFNYMREEHGLTLLENEMQEIVRISEEILRDNIEEYIYTVSKTTDLSFKDNKEYYNSKTPICPDCGNPTQIQKLGDEITDAFCLKCNKKVI